MTARPTAVLVTLALAGAGFTAGRADAWGEEGHVIVARIAELNLSPEARQALAGLLPDAPFSDSKSISDTRLASYADFVKHNSQFPQYKDSAPWHFVDIPVSPESDYDAGKVCKQGQCVLAQIERFRAVLADANEEKVKRQEALVFLVHLVGDLHQPLHCATRGDNGGNKVTVTYLGRFGQHLNLHAVWDVNLVRENMKTFNPANTAADLNAEIKDEQRQQWQQGSAKDWMMESYGLARTNAYVLDGASMPTEGEPNLNEKYVQTNKVVVAEQLKKGGVRLAKVLNDALAPASR